MGVHFVNGALVGDPGLDIRKPEALVYAPGPGRHAAAGRAGVHRGQGRLGRAPREPPRLFGGTAFDLTPAPNRFGLAPFYSQHVWIWKNNRAGILSMWNPQVHCPA